MDKELSEPAFNAILDNFSDVLEQMGHDGVPKQYDPSYALSEMIAGRLPVAKSVRP